jgi:hypothetical protein
MPVKKPAVGQLLHERRNGQFLLQVTGAKLLTARIIESTAIVVVRIRVETLLADAIKTGRRPCPSGHLLHE